MRFFELPLHCLRNKRSLKGQVEGSFHRSKRSSRRSTVSENQEPPTPDNEQNQKTFSRGGATKRYAIRVENSMLKNQKYSFDELMEALKTIPADEVATTELQGCAEKELCIMETLTSWMIQMRREEEGKRKLKPAC